MERLKSRVLNSPVFLSPYVYTRDFLPRGMEKPTDELVLSPSWFSGRGKS